MDALHVVGRGVWARGIANVADFFAGRVDETLHKPAAHIVASRLKRATSIATRAAVDVATQALDEAGLAHNRAATVFGSAHGEIQIAVEQMEMMHEGDGRISPARFKNSVHNTAAGLFSISAENRCFTTAIAAGPDTVAMSLLEGFLVVAEGEAEQVVVAATEEPLPAPVDRFLEQDALSVALALSKAPGQRALGRIGLPFRGAGESFVPERWVGHPVAPALGILFALEAGFDGLAALSEGWCVGVGR